MGQLKSMFVRVFKRSKMNEYFRKQGVRIGRNTRFLGFPDFGTEPYLISIGDNCTLSANVKFINHDGGVSVINNLYGTKVDKVKPIKVGNNVFIGMDSVLLPGVSIGDNCIIALGAIVTKDVPSGEVWGGVPAKKICTIDEYYLKNKNSFHNTLELSHNEKECFYKKLYNIGD